METMNVILGRRSIRRFRPERPSLDALREIVRAATYAASAGNGQPWRFIIVREPGRVDGTTDTLGWLAGGPGADERPTAHVVALVPEDPGWAVQADAAAACQNMLLAATDAGLGTCWCGSVERETLAELLAVPEEWHIYSVVALGYPAEAPLIVEGAGETKVRRAPDGQLVVPKGALDSVLSVDGFEETGAP